MREYLIEIVCDECGDFFKASPYENAYCAKCGVGHILCNPCRYVHSLSASQQDRFLDALERQIV